MRNKTLSEKEQIDRLVEITNQALTERVYLKHRSGKFIALNKFHLN